MHLVMDPRVYLSHFGFVLGCDLRDERLRAQCWVSVKNSGTGRVFPDALTPFSIGQIVKRYVKAAGLDPSEFGGHSLRAGFITSAVENGASIFRTMDVSLHRRVETLRGYVRRAEEFKDHAGDGLL